MGYEKNHTGLGKWNINFKRRENESLQDPEENILKLFAILNTLGEKTCLGDTKAQSHRDNILRCAGNKNR